MYIGRFAPTPSGDLHFGSIVTAIASYLDAKKGKGHWLLKIDDLDKLRVRNNSVLSILRTLESLNLFWDSTESYQSNRLDEYRFYFEKLSATHQTYNCSCSRKYLSAHAKLGDDGYIYPGFCKYKELENKDSYATRMEVSSNPIVIKDQIQGQLSQNLSREIGDFVIKRNDGQFSYQFSVCVDNKLDKITNIVRGADLFSSTPRQVYLHNLLDFDIPKFSHIPIATLGKKKISKSDDCKIIIKNNQKDIWIKVLNFLKGIIQGASAILRLKNKIGFLIHTFFIWACYVSMLWITAMALPDIENISINAVFACFVAGTIAIGATPGGIGLYPIMVASALIELYGYDGQVAKSFGMLMWSSQTIFMILLGLISLVAIKQEN